LSRAGQRGVVDAELRIAKDLGGGRLSVLQKTLQEHAALLKCREAKVEDFRFHDLRHPFASHMMMRGASLGDLRDILGHADVKMTMRYAHLSPEHRRAAVTRLDGLTPARRVDNPVDKAAGVQHMVST